MTNEHKRKLDFAANASTDVVALNNQVVKMRPMVKKSKVYIINKLTKNVKKLKNKKGTEDQKKQNTSKADKLVEEIKVIKVLKPDYIAKYALGATETFEKIIRQPNLDMERRALARLAEHEFIQESVKKFRGKHEDWKELTAYLMTKHTSREFKKKKATQKLEKVATNVKATEKIVETYLGDKLKNTEGETNIVDEENTEDFKQEDTSKIRKLDKSVAEKKFKPPRKKSRTGSANSTKQKDDDSESLSDESDSESEVSDKIRVKRKDGKSVSEKISGIKEKEESSSDEEEDNSDNDYEEDVEENVGKDSGGTDFENARKTSVEHLLGVESSSESKHKSDLKNMKNAKRDKPGSSERTQTKLKNKKQKNDKFEVESKNANSVNVVEKTSGEMIVKKINLEEWTDDSIQTEASNVLPDFLLKTTLQKNRKKVKDPFFWTGKEDSLEEVNDTYSDSSDSIDNEGERENTRDNENTASEHFTGMSGLSTTFLGSLNSDRMMACKDPQYRSNEEWKKLRHEVKTKKFAERGRGRGRGRGKYERGHHKSQSWSPGDLDGQKKFRGRGVGRDEADKLTDQRSEKIGANHAKNLTVSKDSSEESLLRPSYLKQRAKAPAMLTEKKTQPSSQASEKTNGSLLRPSYLTQSTTAPPKNTAEKMHPSWLASKKRKEQQSSIHQFQGKRIKFDD